MQVILNGGTIARIHVNRHMIVANTKDHQDRPVFTVKRRGKTYTASQVDILGESRTVYRPDKPLSCGAKVWIETTADVRLSYPTQDYSCEGVSNDS